MKTELGAVLKSTMGTSNSKERKPNSKTDTTHIRAVHTHTHTRARARNAHTRVRAHTHTLYAPQQSSEVIYRRRWEGVESLSATAGLKQIGDDDVSSDVGLTY